VTQATLPLGAAFGPGGVAASVAAGLVVGGGAALFAHELFAGVGAYGKGEVDPVALERFDPDHDGQPTAEDLGIDCAFRTAKPAEFEVLHRYRTALLYLSHAHAKVVRDAYKDPVGDAERAAALAKLLRSTRREAARVEEVHRLWLESRVTTSTKRHDVELYIDDVPSEADLLDVVNEKRDGSDLGWWGVAKALRKMVTCKLLDRDVEPAEETRDDVTDGTILYRSLLLAELTTWKVEQGDGGGWFIDEERTERVLVSHPLGRRAVRLPIHADADSTFSVGFDPEGGLTEIASDRIGVGAARTETFNALPAALTAIGNAGKEVATAVSPATRAATLKARLEEIETRAKIQGLLNPTTDELADLRQQVAEAELEARLRLSQRIASDPTSVVMFSTTTTSSTDD
jgi:hypothetical protein